MTQRRTTHQLRAVQALVTATLTLGALVLVAPVAEATTPGTNGRVAFRRFLDEDQTTGAVFTIRPDGSGERQVTFPPSGFVDRNPDVSPDGRRIAFEREGEHYDEVFRVDADGSHLRQLTASPAGTPCDLGGTCSGTPAWSPDGRRIAFRRGSGPVVDDLIEKQALYVMRSDGSHVRQLTQLRPPNLAEDSDPQWSPDGRRLVFQRNNVRGAVPENGYALVTLRLSTGRERRITPWKLRAGDTPDWSPDGRRILFHSNVDGPEDVSANLYTVRPDGRGLRQLTFEVGGTINYLGSSYSPDGKLITFGRRPATGGTNADVFVADTRARQIRPVTRTALYDSYPDWGPRPGRPPR